MVLNVVGGEHEYPSVL